MTYSDIYEICRKIGPPPRLAPPAGYGTGHMCARGRPSGQNRDVSTAAALAVALPATGLIVAVVLATGRLVWNGLSDRIDEQGRGLSDRIDEQGRGLSDRIHEQGRGLSDRIEEQGRGLSDRIDEQGRGLSDRIDEQGRGLSDRIDEQGRRLDAIERQSREILRALGRIEGLLRLPTESTEVA